MFGKLLALPLRVINIPLAIPAPVVDTKLLSVPLEATAEVVEETVDGEDIS